MSLIWICDPRPPHLIFDMVSSKFTMDMKSRKDIYHFNAGLTDSLYRKRPGYLLSAKPRAIRRPSLWLGVAMLVFFIMLLTLLYTAME